MGAQATDLGANPGPLNIREGVLAGQAVSMRLHYLSAVCAAPAPLTLLRGLDAWLPPVPTPPTGKYGEWRFDKRSYATRPPPRNLGEPPEGMKNELVRHLIHAINEATSVIPGERSCEGWAWGVGEVEAAVQPPRVVGRAGSLALTPARMVRNACLRGALPYLSSLPCAFSDQWCRLGRV
jgi:hypothetical protein